MKNISLLGILLLLSGCCTTSIPAPRKPAHKLAYGKNGAVWVANIDGTGAKKISGGQSPDLSPDGSKLAFNLVQRADLPRAIVLSPDGTRLASNTVQATGKPAHRKIAIADLATGRITILKSIPSGNCLGATWSPEGTKLLFYFYPDAEATPVDLVSSLMRIGIINADGTGFRDVQKSEPKYKSYWAATWAADGRSFFAEDMEYIYRLDLEGKVLKKWKIEAVVPKGSMSGDTRLHASADGKTLLMDVEMDEKERKGWDGPPDAIWTFDLATGKAARLTPKTLYAWDCHWLSADSILFASENPGEETPCIYRMSVSGNGKDRKLLVKNATLPGAAP